MPSNTCDVTIDVSHWQGTKIDWAKVAAAGKKVAMIKATQGTGTDSAWSVNQKRAAAAGLVIIPYAFISHDDAQDQIDHFVDTAGITAGMAVALDWEGMGAPPATLVEAVGTGVAAVTGRAPLGYWGMSPPGHPTPAMGTWPRWIPRYGVNNGHPDPGHPVSPPWLFWQYTSKAHVNGIGGNVDASLFAGTEAELINWCQTGALPAP